MSKITDDGGEAGDMMLRDWFAGQALAGFVSACAFNQEAEGMMRRAGITAGFPTGEGAADKVDSFIAMLAYDVADAMIREKRSREYTSQ